MSFFNDVGLFVTATAGLECTDACAQNLLGTSGFGEAGARRAQKAFQLQTGRLRAMLVNQTKRHLETVVFHLGELLGLALGQESDLGLCPVLLRACLQCSLMSQQAIIDTLWKTDSMKASSRIFFDWLEHLCRRTAYGDFQNAGAGGGGDDGDDDASMRSGPEQGANIRDFVAGSVASDELAMVLCGEPLRVDTDSAIEELAQQWEDATFANLSYPQRHGHHPAGLQASHAVTCALFTRLQDSIRGAITKSIRIHELQIIARDACPGLLGASGTTVACVEDKATRSRIALQRLTEDGRWERALLDLQVGRREGGRQAGQSGSIYIHLYVLREEACGSPDDVSVRLFFDAGQVDAPINALSVSDGSDALVVGLESGDRGTLPLPSIAFTPSEVEAEAQAVTFTNCIKIEGDHGSECVSMAYGERGLLTVFTAGRSAMILEEVEDDDDDDDDDEDDEEEEQGNISHENSSEQ